MNKYKFLYWLLLSMIFLAGCSLIGKTQPGEDQLIPDTPIPTFTPVDTPKPLLPIGVLLTPQGADPGLVDELNSIIGGYIRSEGLRYQVLENLAEGDFQSEQYQIVVVLPPFPGLSELAQKTPDTKFLAVGFNDLEPGDNLSVLRSASGDYDVQGFIAGYIAAMITTDWRVGVLSVQENENALAAREGFQVGVKYYCGLCNPKYAPTGINYVYPKYIDLPVDASDLEITANIDFMVDRFVNTFYIVPGVGSQTIYRSLVGYHKYIIGSGSDYQEEYRDYWVVSLEYDLVAALEDFWPEFLSTETGLEKTLPLILTDVNNELLGEGKIRMVEGILEEVNSGFIQTRFD